MSVAPSTSGVTVLPYRLAEKRAWNSSLPSARPRPRTLESLMVTIIFVPSTVMSTGEEYAGASPVHFHASSPVLRS
jgi:hypothetical protein